ncbi:MAG: hypothetical protein JW874_08290 [Spirochaetales bacterium]|nr:hypothetical protein [Spirochaetales bacterium]
MKIKRQSIFLLFLITLVFCLSSCEEFFTTSVLDDLQRDPSALSDEQFEAAAEAALETGDTDQIEEIYIQLGDLPDVEDDPEIYILAVDLGVGASGMNDLIEEVLEDPAAIDEYEDLDEMLSELNTDYLIEAAENLLTLLQAIDAGLVSGVEVDDAQIASVAMGMLMAAMVAAGGSENFVNNYPNLASGSGLEELQMVEELLSYMDTPTSVEDLVGIMGITL